MMSEEEFEASSEEVMEISAQSILENFDHYFEVILDGYLELHVTDMVWEVFLRDEKKREKKKEKEEGKAMGREDELSRAVRIVEEEIRKKQQRKMNRSQKIKEQNKDLVKLGVFQKDPSRPSKAELRKAEKSASASQQKKESRKKLEQERGKEAITAKKQQENEAYATKRKQKVDENPKAAAAQRQPLNKAHHEEHKDEINQKKRDAYSSNQQQQVERKRAYREAKKQAKRYPNFEQNIDVARDALADMSGFDYWDFREEEEKATTSDDADDEEEEEKKMEEGKMEVEEKEEEKEVIDVEQMDVVVEEEKKDEEKVEPGSHVTVEKMSELERAQSVRVKLEGKPKKKKAENIRVKVEGEEEEEKEKRKELVGEGVVDVEEEEEEEMEEDEATRKKREKMEKKKQKKKDKIFRKHLKERMITPDITNQCIAGVLNRMHIGVPVYDCACCGKKELGNLLDREKNNKNKKKKKQEESGKVLDLTKQQDRDYCEALLMVGHEIEAYCIKNRSQTIRAIAPNAQYYRVYFEKFQAKVAESTEESVKNYLKVFNHYVYKDEDDNKKSYRYALHPELVSVDKQFRVCMSCNNYLKQKQIPPYSIRAGYDFGNLARVGLPNLSDVAKVVLGQCSGFGASLIK